MEIYINYIGQTICSFSTGNCYDNNNVHHHYYHHTVNIYISSRFCKIFKVYQNFQEMLMDWSTLTCVRRVILKHHVHFDIYSVDWSHWWQISITFIKCFDLNIGLPHMSNLDTHEYECLQHIYWDKHVKLQKLNSIF